MFKYIALRLARVMLVMWKANINIDKHILQETAIWSDEMIAWHLAKYFHTAESEGWF